MDLTAIVACKNRDRNIAICVNSIAMCSPRPKLILVDFGSTDPLERFEKRFSWVKVIRVTKNVDLFHKTRALNIGIKAAKTKYVCLTDADQIFQKNFFGEVIEAAKKPKVIVMCSTYFLDKLPNNIFGNNFGAGTYKTLLELAKQSQKPPHGEGCCHGVDRNWLIKVRGHDERFWGWGFEDKDLVMRAMHCGYKVVEITDKTSMVHLPHERNKKYFNKNYRLRNERMFNAKKSDMVVRANGPGNWGLI